MASAASDYLIRGPGGRGMRLHPCVCDVNSLIGGGNSAGGGGGGKFISQLIVGLSSASCWDDSFGEKPRDCGKPPEESKALFACLAVRGELWVTGSRRPAAGEGVGGKAPLPEYVCCLL